MALAAGARGLGAELPVAADADEGAEFRTWEAIVDRVYDAARGETLVVVLDDLHWADPPSLRVLRLVAERADSARLLVLATWRSHPEPAGALADVAEALARRHAATTRARRPGRRTCGRGGRRP